MVECLSNKFILCVVLFAWDKKQKIEQENMFTEKKTFCFAHKIEKWKKEETFVLCAEISTLIFRYLHEIPRGEKVKDEFNLSRNFFRFSHHLNKVQMVQINLIKEK